MGKVAYLSPEQCQTNQIDQRSDLFSLGVVLYEMITHVRPFKRQTDYETLAAIVRFDPPPPSSVVPGLPPEIDELALKALAKDPDQRFQTAHEMLDAIEKAADVVKASLAPRDLKRYMRDLYGTPPEPWRTLASEENLPSFSGEVIGPLPADETRIRAFPADASAIDVPLLPGAVREKAKGTPGATHDDLDDALMTPWAKYKAVRGDGTMDLDDVLPTPIHQTPVPPLAPVPQLARPSGSHAVAQSGPHGRPSHNSGAQMRPSASVPPPVRNSGAHALPTLIDPAAPVLPASIISTPNRGSLAPNDLGTMEVITPASALQPPPAYEPTAGVMPMAMPLAPAKPSTKWPVVIVTVLAIVGVGIGAMLAMGGGNAKEDAVQAAPRPTVTPIEEPAAKTPPPAPPAVETKVEPATAPAIESKPEPTPAPKSEPKPPVTAEKKPAAIPPAAPKNETKAPRPPSEQKKPATTGTKVKKPLPKCDDPLDCQH
jgi:hypothetical protein